MERFTQASKLCSNGVNKSKEGGILIYYKNNAFTDEQFSMYLTNEYLEKHFEHIDVIKSKYKPVQIARILGEGDISFFCLYYLRDIFVVSDNNEARELSQAHYEMWDVLNKTFVDDVMDKVNMVEPRGMAKTTVCDLALGVWLHCYKKSKFTLMGAKIDDDATQFLDSIKKVFKENERIKTEFGELINTKKYKVNSNELELTNDTYIRAIGSASSVRGANWKGIRPTVVIADDYQSEIDIITEDAREKKFNRWSKEVEKVGDTAVYRNGKKVKSATKIINIGTVLHNDCLISRLARNKDYYTVLKRAIIVDDISVDDIFESELWVECKKLYFDDKDSNSKFTAKVFYENNKEKMKYPLLWEEKWDFFDDIAVSYWENRRAFMSEMQNDATSIGEKWFKSIRTQSREEIENHNFIKTMLCIDPASTQTKRSDYTAIIVGSQADNDFKYIRDIELNKIGFNAYCEKVVEKLREYEDITHIYIEKNTFNGADVVKIKELISNDGLLKYRDFTFINEMQRKNKDEKIETITDPVNNGQIIFVDDKKDALQQILDFQGQDYSPHDDLPDVVAEFSNRIVEIEVVSEVTLLDRRKLGV